MNSNNRNQLSSRLELNIPNLARWFFEFVETICTLKPQKSIRLSKIITVLLQILILEFCIAVGSVSATLESHPCSEEERGLIPKQWLVIETTCSIAVDLYFFVCFRFMTYETKNKSHSP